MNYPATIANRLFEVLHPPNEFFQRDPAASLIALWSLIHCTSSISHFWDDAYRIEKKLNQRELRKDKFYSLFYKNRSKNSDNKIISNIFSTKIIDLSILYRPRQTQILKNNIQSMFNKNNYFHL